MSTKVQKVSCACCGVFHDPKICTQCQVAGCATTITNKNHKCHLQGTLVAAMQLSEFQLRARVVELERQNAELLMESQRLAKENFELREARKAA